MQNRLELGDLAQLIRLVEIDLFQLQNEIDGEDLQKSNDAAEVIIQTHHLATKLERIYRELWKMEKRTYPDYDALVMAYKKHPPFI